MPSWPVESNAGVGDRDRAAQKDAEGVTRTVHYMTRGRVRAGPSFHLGTLSTRIANLLGACDFRDSTKVPVSRDP